MSFDLVVMYLLLYEVPVRINKFSFISISISIENITNNIIDNIIINDINILFY